MQFPLHTLHAIPDNRNAFPVLICPGNSRIFKSSSKHLLQEASAGLYWLGFGRASPLIPQPTHILSMRYLTQAADSSVNCWFTWLPNKLSCLKADRCTYHSSLNLQCLIKGFTQSRCLVHVCCILDKNGMKDLLRNWASWSASESKGCTAGVHGLSLEKSVLALWRPWAGQGVWALYSGQSLRC